MLPVACLPVCGILMGIGYALSPATMQGGDITGAAAIIGFFLIKAGAALIDNMSWLFAVGVGVGMSDDNDGTAGLAGLVSWLTITTILASGTIAVITGAEADPAFAKIVGRLGKGMVKTGLFHVFILTFGFLIVVCAEKRK